MSDWYRQEFPEAPQGHALASGWNGSIFLAWEDTGDWRVKRIDKDGFETPTVTLPDFTAVRDQVEKAKVAYENPASEPSRSDHGRYLHAGLGALGGTVAGMLLGGLPGIVMKHTALATVGAQVGGVIGAATGAVVADKLRSENPESSVASLKRKLLQ